jgi:poly(beta-D-mannuronate) lyase
LLLALIGVFALSDASFAAVRSVCTNSELKSAISAARAGDVISMCAGSWVDTSFAASVAGTADQPITIKAATPGKTVLTGLVHLELAGKYLVLDGLVFTGTSKGTSNAVIDFKSSCVSCRVTNVAFNAFNPSDLSKTVHWILVRGVNQRVDHSYFYDKRDQGQMVALLRTNTTRNDFKLDHNYFARRPNGAGEAVAIGTSGEYAASTAGATVERNYFYDIDADPEYLMIKSSGNTIRSNVFKRCRGAVSLRQGNDNVIYGNYWFGESAARTGGVRVRGDNQVVVGNMFRDLDPDLSYLAAPIVLQNGSTEVRNGWLFQPPTRDPVVAWNTFVKSGHPIVYGAVHDAPIRPAGVRILNNIFESPVGSVVRLDEPFTSDTVINGNIYNNGSLGISSTTGFRKIAPNLYADSKGVYRIPSSSPAVDSATSAASLVASKPDIDGEARGSNPDVGADESSGARAAPVTECDVGPVTFAYGALSNCETTNASAVPNPPTGLTVN